MKPAARFVCMCGDEHDGVLTASTGVFSCSTRGGTVYAYMTPQGAREATARFKATMKEKADE